MKPVLALIGRPNVGKSTLFNQITKTRNALVADIPGLTRDRQYGDAKFENKSFIVVDTGGIGETDDAGIDSYMAEQSRTAIEEADIVLFVVDARAGLTAADEQIAKELRTLGKKIHVVANKSDGIHAEAAATEFFKLGLGEPILTAASHGRGISQMLEDVLIDIPEDIDDTEEQAPGLRLAVIGRPNVGKSTLVNRLLGEDRVVVYDMPGTTRDSIYIPYERQGKQYTLIDTAGVRRRGKVDETIEKFSVVKTLQAMRDAHVVVIVIDAREGIVEQDLHLIGFALEAGRAVVIAINKWDGMSEYDRKQVKEEMQRRFDFIPWAKVHLISALHGTGVGDLYPSIHRAYDSAMLRVPTHRLTQILEDAIAQHQPPMVSGRRVKLRYAHMGGQNPPVIVIHGNQTDHVPADYRRYLENVFRKVFKMQGTPIQIEFKSGENPFAGRKKVVDERVAARKRRFIQGIKRAEKKRGR